MDHEDINQGFAEHENQWVLQALDATGEPTWHWELPALTDESVADLLGVGDDLPTGPTVIDHGAVEALAVQLGLRIDVDRTPGFVIGRGAHGARS